MKKVNFNLLNAAMLIGAITLSAVQGDGLLAQQSVPAGPALKPQAPKISEAELKKKMAEDGLSGPEIDKRIAERNLFLKKHNATVKMIPHPNANKNQHGTPNPKPMACNDLGVENGWNQWMGAIGSNSGGNPGTLQPPVANPPGPRFNLSVGTGVDPCTPGTNPTTGAPGPPIQNVAPGFGNTSIQLGEQQVTGCMIEQLTFPFTPTALDTNLVYAFAAVLYDPSSGHGPTEKPYVEFKILDANGDTVPCSFQRYVSDPNLPGWFRANTTCLGSPDTYYKPWTIVGVNLSNYVGQTLTCVIDNHDCVYCGHYAHSYWDVKCGPVPLAAGCVGNQSSITAPASDATNPYTYQWYQNGNLMSGQTGQTLVTTPAVGDTFAVQVSQGSGCNFYLTYVPAIAIPNFNFTGQCGSYVFKDSSYITPAGSATITNWNWNFPGGSIVSGQGTGTVSVTYPPGNYTASLTITSSSGCTATIPKPLTVGGFPTAAILPTAPCLGVSTTLTDGSVAVNGDPITQWNWTMTGGTPASATTQNTSTLYGTPGTHIVQLVVTSQQGCKDTITQQVIVYNPPIANFVTPDSGCSPVCQVFTDQSTSTDGTISGWQWTMPGGSPNTASGSPTTPSVCYYTPGTYSVSLIVTTSYGCKDTINLPMIEVYDWPTANFCVTPQKAPTTNPVFYFCDMWSSDVVQWSWNFGDNDSDLVSTDPSHSYSATATANDFYAYQICIRVENQHGCWDTTCKIVELIPEFMFYIPNTFTPNGDWINEDFFGKSRGVKEYNLWIFDRWGNQVFDCHVEDKNTNWDSDATIPKQEGLSSHNDCHWDGKVVQGGLDMGGGSKQLAQEDVYVWKVRLTDIFDKKHTYIGHVNIVR